jgi:hypothetical protein
LVPKEILSTKILINLAVTFLHELLHINWVHKSGRYGQNQKVIDYAVEFYDQAEEEFVTKPAYGPLYSKIVARWPEVTGIPGHGEVGGIIARSAENLALYALAKYLTVHLGAYPHFPLVNTNPVSVEPQPFIVEDNGQVFLNSTYQDEEPGFVNATAIRISQFIPDSEYPSSYLTNWNYWANPGTQMSILVSHWILANSAH